MTSPTWLLGLPTIGGVDDQLGRSEAWTTTHPGPASG